MTSLTLLAHKCRSSFVVGSTAFLLLAGTAQAEDSNWVETLIRSSGVKAAAEDASGAPRRSSASVRKPRLAAPIKRPVETAAADDEPKTTSSLSGGITWQATSSCVPSALRGVLADLVGNFGPVTVTSTCRGRSQNRVAGGAQHSYHLTGEAVDFRVSGNPGAVKAFLAASSSVGGLKHYGGGLYHIDTGPRRSW